MKKFPFLYFSLPRWLALSIILLASMFTAQKTLAAGPCAFSNVHAGIITADETWCADGDTTHYLTNDVWVQAGVTLTIAPGVTIDSTADVGGKYLIVQGHLDINGTPVQPVSLTRFNYPDANWGGLYFDGSQGDGSGTINYAIIEHAGSNFVPPGCTGTCGTAQTAVFVKDLPAGRQVTINNSTIRDNTSKGLYVVDSTVNVTNTTFSQHKYPMLIDGAASVVTYSGNTFSDNAYPYYDNQNYMVQEDAIFINPDALTGQDFSLPAQTGLDAYVLWGNTTIPAGVTMSVEPGVTLRKEGGHFLTVQGHLEAIGTQALPIRFTGIPSVADPAVMLQWGGLFFDGAAGDGSGDLTYTTVERGGNNFMPPGCVGAGCASQNAVIVKDLPAARQLNIDHSSIEKSLVRGLYIVNSIVNVTNTTFSQNKYPIWIEGADSIVSYSGNNFVDNTYGENVNYPMPLDAIVINPDALMGHDFSLPVQSGLDFYVFPQGTRIPFGRTMTVESGVTLRTSPEKHLTIQGHLNAVGTQALPIRFSGIPDYSDLTHIFNWGGLFFDGAAGDGSGNLIYTTIERGGSNFPPPDCAGICSTQNAVFVKDLPADKQLNINHSIIEDSLSKGLYAVNSPTLQVNGNLIKGGRVGAHFASNMTLSNLAVTDQVLYGVVVETGYSVDAQHLTIARAGQIGFYTAGTSQLKNSILSHNALAVQAEGSGQAILDTNLADANTSFKAGAVTDLNTINGSAAFDGDGYHIQTTSDAVGKGLAGLGIVDIDGDARPAPAGSLPDLGADEIPVGTDGTLPSVVGSNLAGTNPTSADNVDFMVIFSEDVTGVDLSDFTTLSSGTVSGASVTGVSGADAMYTVSVNTGTGSGTLGLVLIDDDSIVDAFGTPLGGVGSGNGDFTNGESYTVDRPLPGAFTKSSPANAATNQPVDVTLTWQASSGATSYEYCFDATNDSACNTWIDNGNATSVALSGVTNGTRYYWHVRAVNAVGARYSNGSATAFRSFTTIVAAPGVFSKLSPANGAVNQPIEMTLSWEASRGVMRHDYCYDTTNDNTCSNWVSNGQSTSVTLSGLSYGRRYYWHVRAVNAGGTRYSNGSETAFRYFTTIIASPGIFSKNSPANGATNQPLNVTLSWQTSSGATRYDYCYDTSNDSACTTWISNGQSTSVTLTGLSYGTRYYWHVRAVNAGGTTYSNNSATAFRYFNTIVGLPGAFSKSSPASGAVNQPLDVTLSWGASSGATSYEYCYDTTNDSACSAWTNNGSLTSVTLSGLTNGRRYYWHVRAFNAAGTRYSNGSATAFRYFNTIP